MGTLVSEADDEHRLVPPFTSRIPQLLPISDSHHRPQTGGYRQRGLTSGRSGGHALSLHIFRRTTSRVGSFAPDTAASRAAAPCLRPLAKVMASSCMSCHFLTTREALSEPGIDDGDLLRLAPARHGGAEKRCDCELHHLLFGMRWNEDRKRRNGSAELFQTIVGQLLVILKIGCRNAVTLSAMSLAFLSRIEAIWTNLSGHTQSRSPLSFQKL